MGKSAARKAHTSKAAAQKVHVNDPSRRKAPKHDSVKKATAARLRDKAANLNSALPDTRPTGPRSGDVIPTRTGGIPKGVDEFGNKLSPVPEIFDGGGDAA
jgi:hypothetical protein